VLTSIEAGFGERATPIRRRVRVSEPTDARSQTPEVSGIGVSMIVPKSSRSAASSERVISEPILQAGICSR